MNADLLVTTRRRNSYQEWNQLLANELFPPGRLGASVYLAVHDGLLKECGARYGLGGREEFVSAVLSLPSNPSRLFIILEEMAELWVKNGRRGIPPIVAGLAFAVLAASEMTTDDNATQANYYYRLNDLLGIVHHGKPDRFEATPDLWRILQTWLRNDRRGELIVCGLEGQHPFVDPVQSQCLIRSCDLPDFLSISSAIRQVYASSSEPEDVKAVLRTWLIGEGANTRLARILGRDPDESAIQQAAEALCNAWEVECSEDNATQDKPLEHTIHPAVFAVRLNPYPNLMWKRAKWLLRMTASADAEEPECLVQIKERVAIAKLDVRDPSSYDAEITHIEAVEILRGKIRVLDDNGNDVTPLVASTIWLRDAALDGRPGSWHQVKKPIPGVYHTIVLLESDSLLEELKESFVSPPVLLSASKDSWPGIGIIGAWSVRVREGSEIPGCGTIYSRVPILRLQGGLRLHRCVYLRGALPSLALDSDATIRIKSLDESIDEQTISTNNFSELDLPEGRFSIECNGAISNISIVEPRWKECRSPDNTGKLDPQIKDSLIDATVSGAKLSVSSRRYFAHFHPGIHYRVYSPRVIKGLAPSHKGINEHISSFPIVQTVLVKRERALLSLPTADCLAIPDVTNHGLLTQKDPAMVNRLLEYLSARGNGNLESIKAFCVSIAGDFGWHRIISTLEDLGHIDISWDRRSWYAAPQCIVPRASNSVVSILTGLRARQTASWLNEHGMPVTLDLSATDARREIMPDCFLISNESIGKSSSAILESGLNLLSQPPSEQMAVHVCSITDFNWWVGPHFYPAISHIQNSLQLWDPINLLWKSTRELNDIGLYRWREQGRVVSYLKTEKIHAAVRDPSAAKWFLLTKEKSYLRYDAALKRLVVPCSLELPRIFRRICVLASGLAPLRLNNNFVYHDITLTLARLIAIRLGQQRMEGIL